MKKKIIVGAILIFLAVGGTLAMNTVKITYGFAYNRGSHYFTFYPDGHFVGGYKSDSNHTKLDGHYTHSYETGDLRVSSGSGKINPYIATIDGYDYVNIGGIILQIILGTMYIVGICELTIAASLRAKNEEKKE